MWKEVKDAIKEYIGNHYKPDRAFHEISDLRQTGTVQKYFHNIDRLNVYAKMMNHQLISIILNGITPRLHQAMAHCDDLNSNSCKRKEKLLPMNFITSKF